MQYYLVNVTWTSKSEKEVISSFIVESLSCKDAINRVLLKHSFHLLDERLQVYAVEIGVLLRTHQTAVYSVGNTVLNG